MGDFKCQAPNNKFHALQSYALKRVFLCAVYFFVFIFYGK